MRKLLSIILCVALLTGVCAVATADDDVYYVTFPESIARYISEIRYYTGAVVSDLDTISKIDRQVSVRVNGFNEIFQTFADYSKMFNAILPDNKKFEGNYVDLPIPKSYVDMLKSYELWLENNISDIIMAYGKFGNIQNSNVYNLKQAVKTRLPTVLQLIG